MRRFYSLVLAGVLAGSMWLTPAAFAQTVPPSGVSAADNSDVQLVAQRGWGSGRGWGWGGYYAAPRYYYPRNYGSYYYPRSPYQYYGNTYAPSYSNCYYDYNTGSYVCYSPYYGWYQTY